MKKLILGFVFLAASMSTFADTGLQGCKTLLGKYSCEYQNQNVDLSISSNKALNSIKISIAGEGQDFIVDGASHKSSVDDSQNIAECKADKEIVIDNLFRGELKGSFSVLKTAEGLVYTMIQGGGPSVALTCKKK